MLSLPSSSILDKVKLKSKRHIASWLLLAVFVPMLLLSSVHVHDEAPMKAVCDACVHHHCSGHIGLLTDSMDDCVLCQFLTLPKLVPVFIAFVLFLSIFKIIRVDRLFFDYSVAHDITVTRGPPFVG